MGSKIKLVASLVGLAPMILGMGIASAQVYKPANQISIPNGGMISSFDISFVDPAIGIYLLADRTNKSINVVNTGNDKLIAQFQPGFVGFTGNNNTSGPNGVLPVNHRYVWAPDGDSDVKVIDGFTSKLVADIKTGGMDRADETLLRPE